MATEEQTAAERPDATEVPLEGLRLSDEEYWQDGPPQEIFERMRSQCPVHWSPGITEHPDEDGFWSVTKADDVHEVSRDWRTYSSAYGITALTHAVMPLELVQAMFIGMDPPKHDRLKALFQRGFTPKRIAEHEDAIRTIARDVLDRLGDRDSCELVGEVAQPFVSRVIGSFMGIPEGEDEDWARLMNSILAANDPDINPDGIDAVAERDVPEMFERCTKLIAERRENPTDDLTSVLVHAEIDGERLEEHEIVMGFFLLMAAGNDSTKATYCSAMRALMEDPEQKRCCSTTRRWSRRRSRRRCGCSWPRPLPPHRDPRRRPQRPADLRGREGGDVVRLPRTATRAATRTRTASTCTATSSTSRSAPAAATTAFGTAPGLPSCA